jgi:hypothetical protein
MKREKDGYECIFFVHHSYSFNEIPMGSPFWMLEELKVGSLYPLKKIFFLPKQFYMFCQMSITREKEQIEVVTEYLISI